MRLIYADSYNLSRSCHGKVVEHVNCCCVRVFPAFSSFLSDVFFDKISFDVSQDRDAICLIS